MQQLLWIITTELGLDVHFRRSEGERAIEGRILPTNGGVLLNVPPEARYIAFYADTFGEIEEKLERALVDHYDSLDSTKRVAYHEAANQGKSRPGTCGSVVGYEADGKVKKLCSKPATHHIPRGYQYRDTDMHLCEGHADEASASDQLVARL